MTTRVERVKRLDDLGYTNAEIAAIVGVSERTIIRAKREAGIPPKNITALPDSVREEIRRLSKDEGWPLEEISETLGVSYAAAYRWSVRGPGKEWREISARLAVKYRSLWNELRDKA